MGTEAVRSISRRLKTYLCLFCLLVCLFVCLFVYLYTNQALLTTKHATPVSISSIMIAVTARACSIFGCILLIKGQKQNVSN